MTPQQAMSLRWTARESGSSVIVKASNKYGLDIRWEGPTAQEALHEALQELGMSYDDAFDVATTIEFEWDE